MISALTKPRSPSYHRRSMLKVALIALVLYVAWEPIRPVRVVAGEAVSFIGQQIAR